MTKEQKVDKILDELQEEFEKVNLPMMDKLTLFAKVQNAIHICAELQDHILDKIKAEIEQRPYGVANDIVIHGKKRERAEILKIIDKYRIESEGEE